MQVDLGIRGCRRCCCGSSLGAAILSTLTQQICQQITSRWKHRLLHCSVGLTTYTRRRRRLCGSIPSNGQATWSCGWGWCHTDSCKPPHKKKKKKERKDDNFAQNVNFYAFCPKYAPGSGFQKKNIPSAKEFLPNAPLIGYGILVQNVTLGEWHTPSKIHITNPPSPNMTGPHMIFKA